MLLTESRWLSLLSQGWRSLKAKDVDLADELAHAHTRQFRDNFIDFMRENYTTDVTLGTVKAAQ
ncbi:GntR family transcriptional regulator [Rhizobium sp. 2YAF20]|uniref:GntR family transcriptional regulator n=1 Tax=Rhizobium sp. 2YAF20 TaxID=3233027 RepID=UPI003F97A223